MADGSKRKAQRIEYTARALLRGACGQFEATAEDISLTGVRLMLLREEVKLDPAADLGGAAACVQTRVGSRFAVDLGITARGRGRVRKTVQLVRLGVESDRLQLGCSFAEPISRAEAESLKLTLPAVDEGESEVVRQVGDFAGSERTPIDGRLAEKKVERLFDVPTGERPARDERLPERELRALVRGGDQDHGAAPLLGVAAKLTDATVCVRLSQGEWSRWGTEPGDLPAVARGLLDDYGPWPLLEIVDDEQRRLWHGPAHVCGLEIGAAPAHAVTVRLAFSRRLQAAELNRLCG